MAAGDWTSAVEDRCKALWTSGDHSTEAIARILNAEFTLHLSRNAVIGKVNRKGWISPRQDLAPQKGVYVNGQRLGSRVPTAKPKAPKPSKGPGSTWGRSPPPADLAKLKPKPIPPEPMTATIVALVDVPRHACRWPIGDPLEPGFGFCGRERDPDSKNYCPGHAALARGKTASSAPMTRRDVNRLASRYA